jgi:hypothetical protein
LKQKQPRTRLHRSWLLFDCTATSYALRPTIFILTTWLKPIRSSKGKSIAQTMEDSINYILNPKKTRDGALVSNYACDHRTATTEFLMSKREYFAITGKAQRQKDVLLYHMRQSFKPGEITPEEANRIGYALTMRFTKGKYPFIVAVHEDKAHVHCHIMLSYYV